ADCPICPHCHIQQEGLRHPQGVHRKVAEPFDLFLANDVKVLAFCLLHLPDNFFCLRVFLLFFSSPFFLRQARLPFFFLPDNFVHLPGGFCVVLFLDQHRFSSSDSPNLPRIVSICFEQPPFHTP